jgi:hypothetical protein
MSKLRLGPVLEEKPVKITVELSGSLFARLGQYSIVHAKETGLSEPLPPERLIAPMLEHFMATDRAFARLRQK